MGHEDDLHDIEDIKSPTRPKENGATSSVRIRRITKQKQADNCCSKNTSCDCESLTTLFTPDQSRNNYKNTTVKEEIETESSPPAPLVITSNDLNPRDHTVYLKTWGCSHNNSDSEYMAGLLSAYGFNVTTTDYENCSSVILNSCTVKGPSEQHFKNEIERAVSKRKHLILAGCVPQSDKSYRSIASVIGVQQIDRIVEVVEESLRGNKLTFVGVKRNGTRSPGAELSLPKIRKNELIEIVPISTGCLNNCTYCKTKQARGQLASYSIESITSRITHVTAHENIREVWLTSEDLGAWGIDLGLTIVDLLNAIVQVLPSNVMLRLGMTNPPYILDHLEEISRILSHPNVYEFLHIPVQSGSDSVLLEMKREYSRKEFMRICDFMIERHPRITIATDIICGYPTEEDEDFEDTYSLVEKYKFPVLFTNQFYPRPGTAAAKLKRIPTHVVKTRTKKLNDLFQSYSNIDKSVIGTVQRVLVTEIAHDGVKVVGHNKTYQQVVVDPGVISGCGSESIMGRWVDVQISDFGKFSMVGGKGWVVGATECPSILMVIVVVMLLVVVSCYGYF